MKRAALLVTVIALLLSIHITVSIIPMIAYGGNEDAINNVNKPKISNQYVSEIKTKSSIDELGLQDTKLSSSKSTQDIENVMKMQADALKEAKKIEEQTVKEKEQSAENMNNISLVQHPRQRGIVISRGEVPVKIKLKVESADDAKRIDIRTPSNWEASDFDLVVPKAMKPLIPVVIRMEKEAGINALYLMCVGINETGWGSDFSGKNNYFNWTNDGINHFNFSSMEKFADFSIKCYTTNYVNPDFYTKRLGKKPDNITMEVVNVRYAIHLDGRINWQWTATVSKLMAELSKKRIDHINSVK